MNTMNAPGFRTEPAPETPPHCPPDFPPEPERWRGDLDDAAWVYLSMRPRLFQIAYRILGSLCEAEDVLQDVWMRWQAIDGSMWRTVSAGK